TDIKEEILNRIREFNSEIDKKIIIGEIKEYLKFMNPLPLEQLSTTLSLNIKQLNILLFELIKEHEILAEIRNGQLVQIERPIEEKLLTFYRKVEIIGSKITFNLRIYNSTKFFIKDINLMFAFPDFLNLIPTESGPTDLFIREFEPEAIRLIRWTFRIVKTNSKKFELKKWLLRVNYKNPFGKISSIEREMQIIL
ncbi:MAG: hypothetical protein ACTSWL_01030, partial [Promethearchaeota archaeon]